MFPLYVKCGPYTENRRRFFPGGRVKILDLSYIILPEQKMFHVKQVGS